MQLQSSLANVSSRGNWHWMGSAWVSGVVKFSGYKTNNSPMSILKFSSYIAKRESWPCFLPRLSNLLSVWQYGAIPTWDHNSGSIVCCSFLYWPFATSQLADCSRLDKPLPNPTTWFWENHVKFYVSIVIFCGLCHRKNRGYTRNIHKYSLGEVFLSVGKWSTGIAMSENLKWNQVNFAWHR